MKTQCRICHTSVPDLSKKFDQCLGYLCPECHEFLRYADKVLRRIGVEGVTLKTEPKKP